MLIYLFHSWKSVNAEQILGYLYFSLCTQYLDLFVMTDSTEFHVTKNKYLLHYYQQSLHIFIDCYNLKIS
jgi:hypothetical protein